MTGYGSAVADFGGRKIHAEIKSLNSKALDLSTRLAPLYREHEMEIRSQIARRLERGKVDFSLWVEAQEADHGQTLNAAVVQSYMQQMRTIGSVCGIPTGGVGTWDALVRMPDVYTPQAVETLSADEWQVAEAVVSEAIEALMAFRQQEGDALMVKFIANIDRIENLLHQIEPFEQSRVQRVRERLEQRLSELTGVDYDKNRLEQELIYYIEKLDINEEKQRLQNHLNYFRQTLAEGHGQGKKLGFIAQEMGREINTTGSKSNQAEMQNIVVRMKDELEQIKEQVLNVM